MITLDLRTETKAADLVTRLPQATSASSWWGSGWFGLVREAVSGAWQRGTRASVDTALSHPTAWACITLIASDIAKMPLRLLTCDSTGISEPTVNSAYSPVLRRPNHYQNRIQFIKAWIISKLTRGATYVLKERDASGVVRALYVLDPARVQVMVTPLGDVYYQLQHDALSTVYEGGVTVPASEIIHDIYIAPFHPLCGISPIFASGMATMQGLRIIENTSRLFENGSQPAGVLTAPQTISEVAAKRIQEHWESNFSGAANIGKVAVLGDGLKFEPMAMSAVDAQLIDQLKWGDEKICSVHHVPPYMVGVGPAPTYNNIEALNQQYYSQCLQILIEELELCLEEGLKVDAPLAIEFELDALLRMDSATKMKMATDGVKGGIYTPNNGRRLFNLKPLTGGDTVYMQQQDYALEALARRDATAPAPAAPALGGTPAASKQLESGHSADDLVAAFAEALAA